LINKLRYDEDDEIGIGSENKRILDFDLDVLKLYLRSKNEVCR